MTELVIPDAVDHEFKEHYQELIRSSLLRVAGEEALEPRKRGFLRRHRSESAPAVVVSTPPPAPVERRGPEPEAPAREAPAPPEVPESEAPAWPAVAAAPTPPAAEAQRMVVVAPTSADRRGRLRLVTKILWAVAVVLLVCDALAFGITSWATGIADVAVLALSVVWFLLSSDRTPEADTMPAPAAAPAASVVEPIAAPFVEAEPDAGPVAAAAPSTHVTVAAPLPPAVAEAIDGLRVMPLPMERDAGGHITELLMTAGMPAAWRAVSCRAGTLRGMHAHVGSDDVRIVVEGRVVLGLKDLRPGSPTHGNAALLELSADEYTAVTIPAGVAHGLFAQSNALVLVALTAEEEDEYGCAWNDPGLGIEWPEEPQYLSERDRRAGSLAALAEELAARLTRST